MRTVPTTAHLRSFACAVSLCLGTGLATPGLTHAFTAASTGTRLDITAGPGETNALVVIDDGPDIVVSDGGGYRLSGAAPTGCTSIDEGLTCARASVQAVGIDAGDGDDSVTSLTGFAVSLSGGPGNDTLTGGSAPDTIDGGDGSDTIDAGAGDNTLDGGSGDDTLVAAGGNDRMSSGQGVHDTIDAGDGNNQLTVSDGVAIAGGGSDRVIVDGAAAIDTGAGEDSISSMSPGGTDVVGGDGRDTIRTGAGADTIDAGTGDDDIDAGAGDDTIDGSAGNDVVAAGDGDDSVTFSSGSDEASGGPGSDVLDASLRDAHVTISLDNRPNDGSDGEASRVRDDFEHIVGTEGDDTLLAGDSPTTLDGGGGNDVLRGGPGADVLDGQDGDDLLDGGPGADVYHGGGGFDTADYASRQTPVTVLAANGVAHAGEAAEADTLDGDLERVLTGAGADRVQVDATVAQTIATGSGDDVVAARDDNGLADVLDCGPGIDTVLVDGTDLYGEDCETVYEDGALVRGAGTPNARITLGRGKLRVGRQGTITAVLTCDPGSVGGCAGTVTLTDPRTKQRLSRVAYTALPGQSHGVRVRVPFRWMRILRRRNPTRARLRLTVTARSPQAAAPPFTLRTPVDVTYRRAGR